MATQKELSPIQQSPDAFDQMLATDAVLLKQSILKEWKQINGYAQEVLLGKNGVLPKVAEAVGATDKDPLMVICSVYNTPVEPGQRLHSQSYSLNNYVPNRPGIALIESRGITHFTLLSQPDMEQVGIPLIPLDDPRWKSPYWLTNDNDNIRILLATNTLDMMGLSDQGRSTDPYHDRFYNFTRTTELPLQDTDHFLIDAFVREITAARPTR